MKIPYKSYLIEPAPILIQNGWNSEFYISLDKGNDLVERKFTSDRIHKSEEDAIKYCIQYGQYIIDGKIKDCTVDDF